MRKVFQLRERFPRAGENGFCNGEIRLHLLMRIEREVVVPELFEKVYFFRDFGENFDARLQQRRNFFQVVFPVYFGAF